MSSEMDNDPSIQVCTMPAVSIHLEAIAHTAH